MINSIQDPIDKKPNIIYFKSDHSTTPECTEEISKQFNCLWTTPSNWGELSDSLQVPDALLSVHVDMLTNPPVNSAIEFMDALFTITKFMPCRDELKVGIVIRTTTPRSVIKDLQKTHCQGILLDVNEYSITEVNNAVNAFVNGIPYWPKHILNDLPGSVKKTPNANNITLTGRQAEVFSFITERGSSNKIIAKSLGISESTVKLHVTELFKKYGVRSRTQLAVFSNVS